MSTTVKIAEALGLLYSGHQSGCSYDFRFCGRSIQVPYWKAENLGEACEIAAQEIVDALAELVAERLPS